MKRKTLTQLRDEDFAACLRRVAAENPSATADELINLASCCTPRRYYITYTTVVTQLPRMRKKGLERRAVMPDGIPSRERWIDINNAVCRYMILNRRATLHDAITHVINFERPTRFFISRRHATDIFNALFRRVYRVVG